MGGGGAVRDRPHAWSNPLTRSNKREYYMATTEQAERKAF